MIYKKRDLLATNPCTWRCRANVMLDLLAVRVLCADAVCVDPSTYLHLSDDVRQPLAELAVGAHRVLHKHLGDDDHDARKVLVVLTEDLRMVSETKRANRTGNEVNVATPGWLTAWYTYSSLSVSDVKQCQMVSSLRWYSSPRW